MKKTVAIVAMAMSSTSAFAATAFWTGQQEQVQTVTYQYAWNCQYNYSGQLFWRIFKNSCPSSVEVE